MMSVCRFTDAWVCKLYKKVGDQKVVDPKTCELCLRAKEITKAARMLDTATALYGEINRALRTMNTYTHRLTRALEKLEASP